MTSYEQHNAIARLMANEQGTTTPFAETLATLNQLKKMVPKTQVAEHSAIDAAIVEETRLITKALVLVQDPLVSVHTGMGLSGAMQLTTAIKDRNSEIVWNKILDRALPEARSHVTHGLVASGPIFRGSGSYASSLASNP